MTGPLPPPALQRPSATAIQRALGATRDFHHGLLAVAAVSVVLAGACSTSNESPAASTGPPVLAPPEGLGLQPVLTPDFSVMGASVAQQMRERYAPLTRAIEDGAATPAELANAYGEMGNLLLAARALDTAEAYYLNAQTLAPGDWRWSHLLGHLYRNRGPLDKAVTSYEHALQLEPDALATLVRLGDVYLALGRPEAAAPLFARAVRLDADSAAAWFGAGRAALARNEDADAVKALEDALARDPGATAIHYLLAMAYRRLGDGEQAQAHLRRQGDVEPRPEDPLLSAIEERFESALMLDFRGGEALAAGHWAAAADYFDEALALSPDSPSLRHRLGTALWRMGDARGAEAEFERIIRTAPEYAEARFNLAMIMARSGRPEEAIAQLSTALEHQPGYVEARVALARILGRNGRSDEALAQYATALEMEPLHAAAALGYAMNLVFVERYQEARDRLTEGMRAFPDDPGFAHALSRLLAAAPDDRVRDGQRALALAERLLELEQEQGSLHAGETFAMALATVGQYPVAVAVQGDVRASASAAGLDGVVRRLTDNLRLYERRQPSRTPWTPAELP